VGRKKRREKVSKGHVLTGTRLVKSYIKELIGSLIY
jgi:hypothetical protein